MVMNALITLKDVSKAYAGKLVFNHVTMSIEPAKPIVIMGKNGCGKSTLLRIIAGVLAHTDGEIIRTPKIKTSYIPDRFPKLPFKVGDYILHMGKIQGMSDVEINNYMDFQFEYLGIPQNIKEQKISKCSKGTIQKVNIMQAFLSRSDLVVMDEPFSDLDEGSIDKLFELLARKSQDKTAIILSCHEKALAQRVTDNLFVFNGQSLAKSSDVSNCLRVKFIANVVNETLTFLGDHAISIKTTDELHEIVIDKDKLREVLFLLFENGCEIYSVNPVA